jgi:hypothetical protein
MSSKGRAKKRKFNHSKKETKMNKKIVLLVVSLVSLSMILAACGGRAPTASNFPTGRFTLPGNESEGILFNEDGTFTAFYYGADVAKGTYSVKGDLYIEESNDSNCGKTPMSFKYTFDGTNLHFELTEESKNDTCENRRLSFDGITYVLTE